MSQFEGKFVLEEMTDSPPRRSRSVTVSETEDGVKISYHRFTRWDENRTECVDSDLYYDPGDLGKRIAVSYSRIVSPVAKTLYSIYYRNGSTPTEPDYHQSLSSLRPSFILIVTGNGVSTPTEGVEGSEGRHLGMVVDLWSRSQDEITEALEGAEGAPNLRLLRLTNYLRVAVLVSAPVLRKYS